MKKAPSGAVISIESTATVRTIFPQESPIVRGIEPDRPACHTTKPEYAEAINRR